VERSCDVVMKGGITSGVVYPLAITRLADEFRLRNLGGTSAGAIAAAAAAAAQYGANDPPPADPEGTAGFNGLGGLPAELGDKLESLFQAGPATVPFLDIVLAATRAEKGGLNKGLAIFWATLSAFLLPAALGPVLGFGFGYLAVTQMDHWLTAAAGVFVAAVLTAVVSVAAVLVVAAWRLGRALPANYYGLCTGYRSDETVGPQPLTTWLADKLDQLAGKDPSEPLTFGDLWGGSADDAEREINLEMVTTCLTQGCAYRLPLDESDEFWFKPSEFADLFPKRIVDWMVAHARPSESDRRFEGCLPLPEPAEMPVVVAARMSLSFPILISAVPLHAIDYGREGVDDAHREPEPCWFSDGGIISNFPIHFFDSPVPRWPTLGINLRPFGRDWPPDSDTRVRMPEKNTDGMLKRFSSWEGKPRLGLVGAFLASILDTSRNWNDHAQARAPGYRDRIVHIAHSKDEGGMNLSMKPDVIGALSERGADAADELLSHYGSDPADDVVLTWKNQRWVRYRASIAALERMLIRLEKGAVDLEGQSILELVEREKGEPPPSYPWGRRDDDQEDDLLEAAQRGRAVALTEALLNLADEGADPSVLTEGSPRPRSELGLAPRA
jgi:predicted acylesterase/phospholipase RssA